MKVMNIQERTIESAYLDHIRCDFCGKLLDVDMTSDARRKAVPHPIINGRFYHMEIHHEDWGAESCESREIYDCCEICIEPAMKRWLELPSRTKVAEVTAVKAYIPEKLEMVPDLHLNAIHLKEFGNIG